MGHVERIGNHLVGSKPMLMADTGVVFNGCRVLLGIQSIEQGKEIAPKFKGYLGHLVDRSNKVNIYDILEGSLKIREGMLS